MSNKLKQIATILANDDVRDPRATLAAIEKVLSAADTPVATIRIFDNPGSKGPLKATVAIDFSSSRIEPRHMKAAILAIGDFVDDRIAEQDEAEDCCECANQFVGESLSELFRKFEDAALNKQRGQA